jgi:ATP-dependent DNA helicase RecG
MTRVDYIRVPGREWVPDPDRRFDTVELRDPLVPPDPPRPGRHPGRPAQGFRPGRRRTAAQDSPIVPQRVIREAVVNA